jgi:hypothetical protein
VCGSHGVYVKDDPAASRCLASPIRSSRAPAHHVDDLDVGRQRIEVLAGRGAGLDPRLGHVEPHLGRRREEGVLLTPQVQRRLRLAGRRAVDEVAQADVERRGDARERGERGGGEVALLAQRAQAAPDRYRDRHVDRARRPRICTPFLRGLKHGASGGRFATPIGRVR